MMREVDALPTPPKWPAQQAASALTSRNLRSAADALHTRNLANGVALAQQAADGHGPLASVFAELGRRYSHLLADQRRSQAFPCGAIASRADFVGVLLEVAGVGETPTAKVPHTPFRVIEGGAD